MASGGVAAISRGAAKVISQGRKPLDFCPSGFQSPAGATEGLRELLRPYGARNRDPDFSQGLTPLANDFRPSGT